VDQVIGAFFLVRRSVFQSLRGFDEQFFVYFEEVDLSRRVRESGLVSVCLPTLRAMHVGGVSSSKAGARRLFYWMRSRHVYAQKHLDKRERLLILILVVTLEPVGRIMRSLKRLSAEELVETVAGFLLFYRWLVTGRTGKD
jgi:hypothetical protein